MRAIRRTAAVPRRRRPRRSAVGGGSGSGSRRRNRRRAVAARGERLRLGEPGELLEHVDRLGGDGVADADGDGIDASSASGRRRANRSCSGQRRGRFRQRARALAASMARARRRRLDGVPERAGRRDFLAASELRDASSIVEATAEDLGGNERVADFVGGSELGGGGGHPQLRHVDAARSGEHEQVAVGDRDLPLLVRVQLAAGQSGAARDLGKGQALATSDVTKVLAELLR